MMFNVRFRIIVEAVCPKCGECEEITNDANLWAWSCELCGHEFDPFPVLRPREENPDVVEKPVVQPVAYHCKKPGCDWRGDKPTVEKKNPSVCDNGELREANMDKKTKILHTALKEIASYGNDGICTYGCDTPAIASRALATYAAQPEVEAGRAESSDAPDNETRRFFKAIE